MLAFLLQSLLLPQAALLRGRRNSWPPPPILRSNRLRSRNECPGPNPPAWERVRAPITVPKRRKKDGGRSMGVGRTMWTGPLKYRLYLYNGYHIYIILYIYTLSSPGAYCSQWSLAHRAIGMQRGIKVVDQKWLIEIGTAFITRQTPLSWYAMTIPLSSDYEDINTNNKLRFFKIISWNRSYKQRSPHDHIYSSKHSTQQNPSLSILRCR